MIIQPSAISLIGLLDRAHLTTMATVVGTYRCIYSKISDVNFLTSIMDCKLN